jgi:hypothetical protein
MKCPEKHRLINVISQVVGEGNIGNGKRTNGKSEASRKRIDEQATEKQGKSGAKRGLGRYTRINLINQASKHRDRKTTRELVFLAASTHKVSFA